MVVTKVIFPSVMFGPCPMWVVRLYQKNMYMLWVAVVLRKVTYLIQRSLW